MTTAANPIVIQPQVSPTVNVNITPLQRVESSAPEFRPQASGPLHPSTQLSVNWLALEIAMQPIRAAAEAALESEKRGVGKKCNEDLALNLIAAGKNMYNSGANMILKGEAILKIISKREEAEAERELAVAQAAAQSADDVQITATSLPRKRSAEVPLDTVAGKVIKKEKDSVKVPLLPIATVKPVPVSASVKPVPSTGTPVPSTVATADLDLYVVQELTREALKVREVPVAKVKAVASTSAASAAPSATTVDLTADEPYATQTSTTHPFEAQGIRAPQAQPSSRPRKTAKGNLSHLSCNTCGKLCRSRADLYNHERTHDDTNLTCDQCNVTFLTPAKLREHRTKMHTRHYCNEPGCGASFSTIYLLRSHQKKHAGIVEKCPYCSKVPPTAEALRKHIHDKHLDIHCLAKAAKQIPKSK